MNAASHTEPLSCKDTAEDAPSKMGGCAGKRGQKCQPVLMAKNKHKSSPSSE
jgi:hypothetical protein